MALALPVDQFVLRDVTDPHGVVRVLRDKWWWCVEGDPRRAIFYIGRGRRLRVGSPQCNSNRAVCERIMPPVEAAVLCQIPMAFVPVED